MEEVEFELREGSPRQRAPVIPLARSEHVSVTVRRRSTAAAEDDLLACRHSPDPLDAQHAYMVRIDGDGLASYSQRLPVVSNVEGIAAGGQTDIYEITCRAADGVQWPQVGGRHVITINHRRADVPVLRAPQELALRERLGHQTQMTRAMVSAVAITLFIGIMGMAAALAAWSGRSDVSHRVVAAEQRITALSAEVAAAELNAQTARVVAARATEGQKHAERESAAERATRIAIDDARRAVASALGGDVDAAIVASDRAIAAFRSRADQPAESELLSTLAGALLQSKAYPQAETYWRRVLAAVELQPHPDADREIEAHLSLVAACRAQDKLKDAVSHAAAALALSERSRGSTDERTTRAMRELIALYTTLERWPEARAMLARVIAVADRPGDPFVAGDMAQLAAIDLKLGKVDDAASTAKHVIARARDLGPAALVTVKAMAYGFAERGRYEQAIGLLEIAETSEADKRMLARLYVRGGRYADAERVYREIMGRYDEGAGPDNPDAADCAEELAELYDRQGKASQKVALLKLAMEIREKSLGPDHPDVARSALLLAEQYQNEGRLAEAAALYALAQDIKKRALERIAPPAPESEARAPAPPSRKTRRK